ncbi:hypothetical protein M427DRAFT_73867 [Gonapodya prolifera JEL478]|uniref:C2H2-type domain-containing protein n=1 Tax=Gonapodya prolifera (strain JEL478) TaxID=1344416 RepID=A0A139A1E5_GONPJ|nr:hypothetical protein M427DRAFT_73867 [Gonapodya prolifera JEL478]|eukprot:KXS10606.1 hypothetical protein M427DRAFT_73867 [Gonapodya prolifera JEL478]
MLNVHVTGPPSEGRSAPHHGDVPNISPPNDIRRRKTFLCPKCGGAFTRGDVMIRHMKRRTCRLTRTYARTANGIVIVKHLPSTSSSSVIHNPTLDAARTPPEASTHSNSVLHFGESSERSWSPPHLLPPLPPATVVVEESVPGHTKSVRRHHRLSFWNRIPHPLQPLTSPSSEPGGCRSSLSRGTQLRR